MHNVRDTILATILSAAWAARIVLASQMRFAPCLPGVYCQGLAGSVKLHGMFVVASHVPVLFGLLVELACHATMCCNWRVACRNRLAVGAPV